MTDTFSAGPVEAGASSHSNPATTILVADDDVLVRKVLKAVLVHSGYRVVEAEDGAQTLAVVKEHSVQGILLDVMMPKLDGFQVCQRLKNDPATAHIPVVLVTALSAQEHRHYGLEAGADDYLSKPVAPTTLLSVVRRLMGDVQPGAAQVSGGSG
jgi:two-component system cell cycle response regulator